MTGLVRKATLLGACGLFVAAAALANVPDPANCDKPNWIKVVGKINGGADDDPFGRDSVVIRDFANNPIANALVKIDFSGCCDINLCDNDKDPAKKDPITIDCATRTATGFTNPQGKWVFTILGAAKDAGNIIPCAPPTICIYGGCGLNGVAIYANAGAGDVLISNATAIVLDQNGVATPAGSNGTTIGDVANVFNQFGARALGQDYKGRADLNCDGNVTIGDVAAEFAHFGRLALIGGAGCTSTFCSKPPCP